MPETFDLFGDLVPERNPRGGRPPHVATQQNRNKVMMLLALGWNNERIARALHITPPTLRARYFSELRRRDQARDRLDAALAMRLWNAAMDGNVGAAKEFHRIVERNDMMLYGRKPEEHQVLEAKLGKKDRALAAAREPDATSPIGELMAARTGLLTH